MRCHTRSLRRSSRPGSRLRTTGWLSKWGRSRFCVPEPDKLSRSLVMPGSREQTLRRFDSPAERQSPAMDALVRQVAFGTPDEQAEARWLIWEIGQKAGVRPASIHELYMAQGRGEIPVFTTPAINIRVLGYDTARAIYRAAVKANVGAVIVEIARSEIGYTGQRPSEFVAVMTAAALREGFIGPLFIQ